MRADAYPLETVLGEKQQWVVPVYQRHYEWGTYEGEQIPKLWEDLRDKTLERLEERNQFPHYFGAIIFSEPSSQEFGTIRKRFLVDGQQRITTFKLALTAIREVARENELEDLVFVVDSYLFNETGPSIKDPERERFKLWPSRYDRSLYQSIVDGTPDDLRALQPDSFYKNGKIIKKYSENLLLAYWRLLEEIREFVADRKEIESEEAATVLEALLASFLTGFQVVLIQLDPNDDAQEIFASLNGLGKPLAPFDLIRNDVFHRARKIGEDDEQLFDGRWNYFENSFWTEEVRQGRMKRARADHLITHAVIAETAREVNAGKIATEYRHYSRERAFETVAEELDVLLGHATTYSAMERMDQGAVTAEIANVLRIWDMSIFHPFILWVNAENVDEEEKKSLFGLLENYIVRREICGFTTKNYNKVVTGMIRALKDRKEEQEAIEAFAAYLNELTGDASKMPPDDQLIGAFVTRKVYGAIPAARLRYIFQQIEHDIRDKFDETTVITDDLTIEHVIPQAWSVFWPLPNGKTAPCESTWEAAHEGIVLEDETKALMDARGQAVDTFGNLTLITSSLNPSIGNGAWSEKKKRIGKSLLALNRDIASKDNWTEAEIESRAKGLAAVACNIWRAS